MTHRNLRALGIVATAIAANCPAQLVIAQIRDSVHPSSISDNPCALLSAEDIAFVTNLDVIDARRVRSHAEATGEGSICQYTTRSELGALSIGFYPLDTSLDVTRLCEARTADAKSLMQNYRGGGLIVCVARNIPIAVSVQMATTERYRDILVSLAQAILDRVADISAESPNMR